MATNDQVNFQISFAPHADFSPHAGDGGSDLLPWDGSVACTVTKMVAYMTEAKPGSESKPALRAYLVVQDADAKGSRLIGNILCGGKDKNGDDLGRQLMQFLASTGVTEAKIRQNAAEGLVVPVASMIEGMTKDGGKTVYVELETVINPKSNREESRPRNWLLKETYEQQCSVGAHRRPRSLPQQGSSAGATNFGGGAANGTAQQSAPTGTSAIPNFL